VSRSFGALGNAQKRAEYDRYGSEEQVRSLLTQLLKSLGYRPAACVSWKRALVDHQSCLHATSPPV
jgi:hypothetical protein